VSVPFASYGTAEQAAEKVVAIVIPGGARNLLPAKNQEKADSSGKPRPRNDSLRVFPQPKKPH
jgi:hypothetical protein